MSPLLRLGLENAATCTVLAAAVSVAGIFLRRRPALMHSLCLLVLLKLITPPLWTWNVRLPEFVRPETRTLVVLTEPVEVFEESDVEGLATMDAEWLESDPVLELRSNDLAAADEAARPASPFEPSIATAAVGVWLAGSLTTLVVGLGRRRRFGRFLAFAEPADKEVEDRLDSISIQMGLPNPPQSRMVWAEVSPMIFGAGKDALLILPVPLWKRLDDAQRDTLLAHELAHIRRGDPWVRWLELAATVVYWWFPVLWWTRRALREAEEQSCDAWVVWAFPDGARAYAETLVETVDFLSTARSPMPAGASGIGHVQHLKRRLIMIMKGSTSRKLGLGGALACFGLTAVLLPFGPTWADDVKPETPEPARIEVRTRVDTRSDDQGGLGEIVVTPSVSPDRLARVEGENVHVVVTDGVATLSPQELTFTTSEGVEAPKAIQEAIAQLKKELKTLEDAKGEDVEISVRRKAVEKAIEALAKMQASSPKDVKGTGRVVIRRQVETHSKPDDSRDKSENEAERRSLEKELENLRGEMNKQNKELREVQDRLHKTMQSYTEVSKKLGRSGRELFELSRATRPLFATVPMVPPVPPTPAVARAFSLQSDLKTSQDKRLAELEKKLERVLDELKDLKKKDSDDVKR